MGLRGAGRLWLCACAVLLALAAALGASAADARTVLELDSAKSPVPLVDWGDTWMDDSGQATADRVGTDTAIPWRPSAPMAIHPLRGGKALWVRFTVPPAPDMERWYLEVPYPSVNRVTLYTQDSIGQWIAQSAGDNIAVADWPVPHRHPLLPVVVSAEEPRRFLLRVENGHSFSAPLAFVSESYLSRHEQRTSLILGIYFGLAGLAATLALLSAVSLRDRAYALYAATVTLMGLTQATMTGIAGLHLWPRLPAWNDISALVLPVVTIGSLMAFFSAVVSLPERSQRLHQLLAFTGLLSIPAAILIAVLDPSYRFLVLVPYIAAATTVGFFALTWAARRGDRWGFWLLVGQLPVVIGAAFPLLRTAGVIPVGFLTTHGMQIGIALELPIVLVILLLRSQHRREHNRRIQGLERIDPATGLINEQVFRERMVRQIAISQRLKLRSAVLLVSITNVEQIRTQFDARSAEELPLRVAGRLLTIARDIDSVARLADHRFGLLIEGPLTADEIAALGPRIVARCLMPFKNKPMEWVAQVRVAQALVPMDGTDADLILGQLEVLLASVPPDSKRAVFNLSRQNLAAGATS